MTEILTESFCERCGSRYTFESAAPKIKMRRAKVLTRGLKNFVLDDKTSLDEAMAAARSDTDREVTTSQLDAFHQTFNFCMQCRQYTCPNCWNDAEGRCLTCAPLSLHAPSFAETIGANGATPFTVPTNGAAAASTPTPPLAGAAPASITAATNGHVDDPDAFDPIARLNALSMAPAPAEPAAPVEAEAPEAVGAPEATEPDAVLAAEPMLAEAAPAEPEPEPDIVLDLRAEAAGLGVAEAFGADETLQPEPEVAQPIAFDAVSIEATDIVTPAVPAAIDALAPPVVVEPVAAEPVASAPVASAPFAEPEIIPMVEAVEPEPVIEPLDELVFHPYDIDHEAVDALAASLAPEDVAPPAPEPLATEPAASEPAVGEPVAAEHDHAAAAAAAAMVAGLRPGQSLDDALDEFERADAPAEDVPADAVQPLDIASVVPEPVTEVAPADMVVEPEPAVVAPVAAEPVAAPPEPVAAPPEPVAAPPEPVAAPPEPVAAQPEPVQPVQPMPQPIPAAPTPTPAPAVDIVAQPTWTVVAPEPTVAPAPTNGAPVAPVSPTPPVAPTPPTNGTAVAPATQTAAPEWPAQPQWPAQQESVGLPFLGRPAVPTGGVEALWAASDQEVTAAPTTDRPMTGVQSCVSCGLSLSATARFCRRCGTAQHA